MAIRCGIVGLPNVGKSTLFNALTAAGIAAENYPFCTIDPNVGVVAVPDPRLQPLAEIVHPDKIIPTTVEFVDIAGLVKGASQGEGLGNKFLANIRETDAIGHVVRCFEDDDIVHVATSIDPGRDIGVINTELILADLETLGRSLDKAERQARAGRKEDVIWHELLLRLHQHLDAELPTRKMDVSRDEQQAMHELYLLTAKPVMYIANVDEGGLAAGSADNPHLAAVKKMAVEDGAQVVVICAALEAEIAQLEDEDQQAFLDELGLNEPGLNRVIRAGYELLGLQTFFTAGPKEVRAWTAPAGATAPEAAGEIHTDFQHGFIRAEVIGYDDYIRAGGEQGAKDAGQLRVEGKEYVVREGDIMHFRFNV